MAQPILIDGRYELIELLGTGVSGEVWTAKQRSVDRVVAVKLLKKMDDDRFAIRFVNEARAIAMLNHPHIVTLFDYGYDAAVGTHFMVMEHVAGEGLADALFEAMTVQDRVAIARDIASALRDAHAAGIMHRDLKPENVVLARDFEGARIAKVLDFGLARIRGLEEIVISTGLTEEMTSTRITQKGEIQGTPAYMSPEQAMGSLEVGPPADVYALGAIVYELLHGHVPFQNPDAWEIIYSQIRDTPQISDSVPALLGDLILTMMSKEPDDRPTADDVVQMLDRYLEIEAELPPALAGDSMIYGAGFVLEESDDSDRWRRAIPILVVFLLVLIGTIGWLLITRSTPDAGVEPRERIVVKEVPVEIVKEVPVEVIKEVRAPAIAATSRSAPPDGLKVSGTLVDAEVAPPTAAGDTARDDDQRQTPPATRGRTRTSDAFEEIKLSL